MDCITLASDVISYAFEKTNNDTISKVVLAPRYSKNELGTKLARDLVTMDHWIGIDVSPDVRRPGDLKQLHTADCVTANTQCHYWRLRDHLNKYQLYVKWPIIAKPAVLIVAQLDVSFCNQ